MDREPGPTARCGTSRAFAVRPCDRANQAFEEAARVERAAAYERQRAEERAWAERAREARRRELADLAAWAAAALTDPNLVILDTETTGLYDPARIVDIAVTTAAGDVLLDTLVDPGVPIPPEATAVHGITDADVAGKP